MLMEIFSYLDRESLLKAIAVNKNWRNVILGNSGLSQKNSQLLITSEKIDAGIPMLTRNYRSICFDDILDWTAELKAQLRSIGSGVTELKFTECVFFDEDFLELLQLFPNVNVMDISCCHEGITPLPQFRTSRIEKVEMKALQSLIVRGEKCRLS
jgi:hypothetical protein